MAKPQNESWGDKALRYGKAFLLEGGILGIGKEVFHDIKQQNRQKWVDELGNAYEKENYDLVINITDRILEEESADDELRRFAKWHKSKGYLLHALQMEDSDVSEQAYEELDNAEDLFIEYGNEYGWDDPVIHMIMMINDCLRRVTEARNAAIYLMESDDKEYRKDAFKVYKENTETLLEHQFTELIPYSERKYIYLGQNVQKIGGTYQWYDDQRVIDWIFTLDQLPSDIVFPLGRPQPGLYLAHPINTDHYYPMKNAEETLFMEKVREFCWLVQCLGATEVSFHSNKGLSVSQGIGSSMNLNAEIGINSVGVGGSYGNTKRQDDSYNLGQQVELVQHFAPKKQAYCPNGLVWLQSDPDWKFLIKQRLEGEIMEYNYKISSSETCQMSANETNEVKANFEYMMYKVNANYNTSTDQTFSKTEETEWAIHVEFAPMEELTENANPDNSISGNEQEYLNMLRESMEDGDITPRERKIMERLRATLGISKERAEELEIALNNPNPTNNINPNSRTTAMTDCFVNNLSGALININDGGNMYPRISEKTQQKLIYKFGMERNEAVLFYRESGTLFKKYTMALTDKCVYYKNDDKQINSFMWKDVIDINCVCTNGQPEYVDFHFSTTQGEHVIFMTEFGIIYKEEVEKYLESVRKGLKQMVNTAKKW